MVTWRADESSQIVCDVRVETDRKSGSPLRFVIGIFTCQRSNIDGNKEGWQSNVCRIVWGADTDGG